MKGILISIHPKWCDLIASGRKTIEVRKTKPKIKTPFKCYIYCTSVKNMPLSEYVSIRKRTGGLIDEWYGKVTGEFACDKISMNTKGCKDGAPGYWGLISGSCMSLDELDKYGNNKLLYVRHISDLVIYDEPKEVIEPPQSWRYVEELNDENY